MTHIRKHERPTTTAAGGGLLLRLLLLLLSAATDVVRATEVYAPDCQATPDGYSSRVGTGCTQYVYCQGGVVTSTYNCPVGTIYNGKVCDWAANVRCAPNIPLLVDDERFFLPETTTVTPEFSIATATTTAQDSSSGAGFLCGNSLTELETTCGTATNCFSDPCPPEAPFCFPFQCTTTSYASTAATMTTTTAATTTAATTTTDATTTTETSRTAATTTVDATTTDTTTTDSTTTTDTTTTETSTTAATMTTDATTTDATTTDATTETTTTDATTTNATTTDTTTTETSTSVADTTTTDATTTTDTTTTETSTTAATTTADATTTDTTTTEASTTAATKPPTYFYPQTFEGNTFCFSGIKTSIAALAKMTPDEQELFLSLTMCECCSKHKCAMGSGMCPTIGPTTFVTTTTDATTTVVSTTDASTTAATTPADATTTDASTTAAATTADATTTNTTITDASTTAATTTANATTTDASTTAATTTTDATTIITTTTAARDAECQTEPFSVKVGTGCREFFYCEGGRIIETTACPAGMRFNGRHCDSAANVDCEPDPDCREQPNFFSAKVSTGCRDYVFCENGLLVETVTCPDGLLFNGMYCDLAMNVNCTFDSPSFGNSGARTRRLLRGTVPANPDKM